MNDTGINVLQDKDDAENNDNDCWAIPIDRWLIQTCSKIDGCQTFRTTSYDTDKNGKELIHRLELQWKDSYYHETRPSIFTTFSEHEEGKECQNDDKETPLPQQPSINNSPSKLLLQKVCRHPSIQSTLHVLCLSGYPGTALPKELGNLINLQEVKLMNCMRLNELNVTKGWARLETLILQNVPHIRRLPSEIRLAQQLKKIVLTDVELSFYYNPLLTPPYNNNNNGNEKGSSSSSSSCCSFPILFSFPVECKELRNLKTVHFLRVGVVGRFKDFHHPVLLQGLYNLMSLRELTFQDCAGWTEFSVSLVSSSPPNLESLCLWNCPDLEYCFGSNDDAPNDRLCLAPLQELVIRECPSLRAFLFSSSKNGWPSPFCNLQRLYLDACPCFESILQSTTQIRRQPFPRLLLEQEEVQGVKTSSTLQSNRVCNRDTSSTTVGQSESTLRLPQLFPRLEHLQLKSLPSLQESGLEAMLEQAGSQQLKCLEIKCCNALERLPGEMFTTAGTRNNLVQLDVSGCTSLIKLPPEIGLLTELTKLNCSACRYLSVLPNEIYNLEKLEILQLASCPCLEYLPAVVPTAADRTIEITTTSTSDDETTTTVAPWKRLRNLNLNDSGLVALPEAFYKSTKSLETLLLSKTHIQSLPSTLEWKNIMHSLKKLDLSYLPRQAVCRVFEESWNDQVVTSCPCLQELSLYHCGLGNDLVTTQILPNLPKSLRIWNLGFNEITELHGFVVAPQRGIAKLVNLETCNLQGNPVLASTQSNPHVRPHLERILELLPNLISLGEYSHHGGSGIWCYLSRYASFLFQWNQCGRALLWRRTNNSQNGDNHKDDSRNHATSTKRSKSGILPASVWPTVLSRVKRHAVGSSMVGRLVQTFHEENDDSIEMQASILFAFLQGLVATSLWVANDKEKDDDDTAPVAANIRPSSGSSESGLDIPAAQSSIDATTSTATTKKRKAGQDDDDDVEAEPQQQQRRGHSKLAKMGE